MSFASSPTTQRISKSDPLHRCNQNSVMNLPMPFASHATTSFHRAHLLTSQSILSEPYNRNCGADYNQIAHISGEIYRAVRHTHSFDFNFEPKPDSIFKKLDDEYTIKQRWGHVLPPRSGKWRIHPPCQVRLTRLCNTFLEKHVEKQSFLGRSPQTSLGELKAIPHTTEWEGMYP